MKVGLYGLVLLLGLNGSRGLSNDSGNDFYRVGAGLCPNDQVLALLANDTTSGSGDLPVLEDLARSNTRARREFRRLIKKIEDELYSAHHPQKISTLVIGAKKIRTQLDAIAQPWMDQQIYKTAQNLRQSLSEAQPKIHQWDLSIDPVDWSGQKWSWSWSDPKTLKSPNDRKSAIWAVVESNTAKLRFDNGQYGIDLLVDDPKNLEALKAIDKKLRITTSDAGRKLASTAFGQEAILTLLHQNLQSVYFDQNYSKQVRTVLNDFKQLAWKLNLRREIDALGEVPEGLRESIRTSFNRLRRVLTW